MVRCCFSHRSNSSSLLATVARIPMLATHLPNEFHPPVGAGICIFATNLHVAIVLCTPVYLSLLSLSSSQLMSLWVLVSWSDRFHLLTTVLLLVSCVSQSTALLLFRVVSNHLAIATAGRSCVSRRTTTGMLDRLPPTTLSSPHPFGAGTLYARTICQTHIFCCNSHSAVASTLASIAGFLGAVASSHSTLLSIASYSLTQFLRRVCPSLHSVYLRPR
uniref:Uncharacterized protein n=1 Tax=Lygus hesperus TaxID=30085 RepID=A0A146M1T2_LYGHE